MAPPGKTSFSVVRKKTPFQKAKAEEELKRKRHAEEAAKLYDEFAASFEADKKPRGMNFVSAGTQAAGLAPARRWRTTAGVKRTSRPTPLPLSRKRPRRSRGRLRRPRHRRRWARGR
jgi:hypothetical protein